MTLNTIALFNSSWPEDMKRPTSRNLPDLYRYAIWYKANPRGADYMRSLTQEMVPDAQWVDCSENRDWKTKAAEADRIVLVYPDSIGLGHFATERAVNTARKAWTDVEVLNSRHRRFRLNRATWIGLMMRRGLEWTMLGEFAFVPVFILATPILWFIDKARGRA